MARRVLLKAGGRGDVGERLLGSKLQILSGTGNRRPSIALSILTGRVAEQLSILESFYANDPAMVEDSEPAPVVTLLRPVRPHLLARTVYLSESHLRDIDAIIEAWQPGQPGSSSELPQADCAWARATHDDTGTSRTSRRVPRRWTRSAVMRRAIEHLRGAVEADPATSLLETN